MEQRDHITIDATDKAIGRIATQIAVLLMGKNKPSYIARIDAGAHVRVINVSKVKFSGKKIDQKELITHSWHPGGLKRVPLKRAMAADSRKVLAHAVAKMLPRNTHRADRMRRLIIEK
ncbi:MAG: 50S ribosomal protein L13 [Candidatus Magasanikbacteria bacterium RIFCSPHIGHO2_01_FULL_50_8]|uniref:50S ribosomal protein L13 n=2 Tax=Candidatus Magasanikiibacteriota TaxID=1752731 RepID=A0A1F6LNI9_9BACT|nr:MAG: 50S ribosomal protein L13 [Candidatus Magasanikbacteria bacterium RIFCSPHIGHO2_01_FULL_50_8]OGH68158.1 MAG: 50S ribosomal protein L13 [Candidatus Magasanikbacteria bacterium RIFCSPHIGHO2_02_FULL_50_9b]